jgi:hypothetical protein
MEEEKIENNPFEVEKDDSDPMSKIPEALRESIKKMMEDQIKKQVEE